MNFMASLFVTNESIFNGFLYVFFFKKQPNQKIKKASFNAA